MSALKDIWQRMQSWQSGVWLPVVPPLGAIAELAVLVAVIEFADWILPGVDVAALEPSPYWIPVLLLSLQYGTVAGLLAAATATLVYVFNGLPEQGVGENLFTYLLHIWSLPILWTGVSLLVGQFRLRQIEVKQDLLQKLTERNQESEGLAGYARGLEKRCMRLERQIATQSGGPGKALWAALSQIDDPAADLDAVLTAVAGEALPGSSLSVFALTPHALEAIATAGWPDPAKWDRALQPSHPLHKAIAGERRAVFVLNRGDEGILQNQGLAAVPVLAPDTGRSIGMIKLEHARPEDIGAAALDTLAVLSRLIAQRLAEPRIAVNNDELQARQGQGAITRGWRQLSWRGKRSEPESEGAKSEPITFPRLKK